jgi:hypothetical protein
MRLGSVGRVEEGNISDLDPHADCCVCGKEVIVFNVGKTVLLIVNQSIFSPTLNHNLLRTMQMRLHDVAVNEALKFQCLKPTNLSHSISVRGDNVDDVLGIPLDLHGVVSCFPTFQPSQE